MSALLLFVSCQKEKSAGESYETIVVDLEQRKTVQEEAAFAVVLKWLASLSLLQLLNLILDDFEHHNELLRLLAGKSK